MQEDKKEDDPVEPGSIRASAAVLKTREMAAFMSQVLRGKHTPDKKILENKGNFEHTLQDWEEKLATTRETHTMLFRLREARFSTRKIDVVRLIRFADNTNGTNVFDENRISRDVWEEWIGHEKFAWFDDQTLMAMMAFLCQFVGPQAADQVFVFDSLAFTTKKSLTVKNKTLFDKIASRFGEVAPFISTVVVPINLLGVHWILLVFFIRNKRIETVVYNQAVDPNYPSFAVSEIRGVAEKIQSDLSLLWGRETSGKVAFAATPSSWTTFQCGDIVLWHFYNVLLDILPKNGKDSRNTTHHQASRFPDESSEFRRWLFSTAWKISDSN